MMGTLRRGLFLLGLLSGCGARTGLLEEEEEIEPPPCELEVEVCNGVDDDCDGKVDEGLDGVPESCNLRDDDCDGEVDEGLGFGPLGDAVQLRVDEGETGDCTSCRWAWGTALAPVEGGLLALWNLGLSGGDEQPTLYGRLVDGSGRPQEEVGLLREDYILWIDPMQALLPLPERGLPFDAEYRVGGSDVPGLLFASSRGAVETVHPTPATGPYNVPRTVWTGERFVSAWQDGDGLGVVSLAADGGDQRRIEVGALERPAAITLGVYPGRVGILVSRYRDQPERRDQWFVLLDARGEVLAPAHQVDLEYDTWQRLVGTAEGWLYVRPGPFAEPATRQTLDVDGDPTSEALAFDDGRQLVESGGQDTFALHPVTNGIVTAWQSAVDADAHVELLDDAGDTIEGWSGTLAADPGYDLGYFADPHITFTGDHLLVVWHGLARDGEPNPVWVRSFGCVP